MYQRIINFIKDVEVNYFTGAEEKQIIINFCEGKTKISKDDKRKLTPNLLLKNKFKRNPKNEFEYSRGLFKIIDIYAKENKELRITAPLISHGYRLAYIPEMFGMRTYKNVKDLKEIWFAIFNEYLIIR